ncbi:DUF192 domain-containing protein [Parvibacter caecicola]|uniref:DUF192 domain-containing protein n=1 Tax=Parvibacter caecicola TaxID=747645 RepID=UPI00249BB7F4|nr:DUF192 domain-containing protein [Parvibacter caecicola]
MADDFAVEMRRRRRRACAVRLSDGRLVAARVAATPLSRLRGLLGRRPPHPALLLTRCHDIHTCGMSAPIDVAFLSGEGQVVKVERAVPPGQRVFAGALACDESASVLERFSQMGAWVEKGDYPLVPSSL